MKTFVRHIPLIGYWSREKQAIVLTLGEATRYTEDEINLLDTRYLFPSERWVLVA